MTAALRVETLSRRLGPTRSPSAATTATVAGLLLIGGYAALLASPRLTASWDTWLALLLVPVLLASAVPLGRRLVAVTGDSLLLPLVVAGAGAKIIGTGLRYAFVFGVSDGAGDARAYAQAGSVYASQLRDGYLALPPGDLVGTRFIELVTGGVFALTQPAVLTGFLLFGFAGFIGLYHFVRAFHLAVPSGDVRLYAAVVFLLPSLVFWPSSIGKESWMMLTLGLAARGSAMVLTRSRGGFGVLAVGIVGAAMVRPHVALLVCIGLGAARLLSGTGHGVRPPSAAQRVLTVVVIVLVGGAVLNQAEVYFDIDEEVAVTDAATSVLDEASRRTGQGGSEFAAEQVTSPAQLPGAVIALLFRPFPHEAHNLQSLIASVEGLALLGLFVWRRRNLAGVPFAFRDHPYVIAALLYSLMFIVAFSSFGNFGILTRQRVQLFPFVLVLLAMAPRPRTQPRSLAQ